MKPYLVLYIPVLHAGYLELFEDYTKQVDGLYLLGRTLVKEHTFLEREIRALDPRHARTAIRSIAEFRFVRILGQRHIRRLHNAEIITADEQIMRRVAAKYFRRSRVCFVSTFLRWDESHVDTKVPAEFDRTSRSQDDKALMRVAELAAAKSSDWWRHVGAVIPIGARLLVGHNEHMPSEYSPYAFGDIRDFIPSGMKSDISSAIHAEKGLIATAAAHGIKLTGRDIYVTTFPCADCARSIAYAGIRRCFFAGGHASFDGVNILRLKDVELIYVP